MLMPALLASLAVAMGPYTDGAVPIKVGGAALTTIACDSPITTDAIPTEGWRFLTIKVSISRAAATDVAMTCKHGDSTSSIPFQIPAEVWGGYTSTTDQRVWKWVPNASESWSWTINLWAYRYLQCVLSCTGANVNDKLTVTATAGVNE